MKPGTDNLEGFNKGLTVSLEGAKEGRRLDNGRPLKPSPSAAASEQASPAEAPSSSLPTGFEPEPSSFPLSSRTPATSPQDVGHSRSEFTSGTGAYNITN